MRMVERLLVVLGGILLGACAASTTSAPIGGDDQLLIASAERRDAPGPWKDDFSGQNPFTEAELSDCRALGGRIIKTGFHNFSCVYPALDAGKPCSDRSNCEGICDADWAVPAGTMAQGKCSKMVGAGGCNNPILSGVAVGPGCSD